MELSAGTVVLSGPATLSAGSLLLQNTATVLDLGASSQNVAIFRLAGGSLQNGSLTASAFTLESGRVSAILEGAGAITKTTSGSVLLTAANTLSGPTDLLAGTLTLAAAGKLSSGSLSLQNPATTLDLGASSQTTDAFRLAGGTLQNGSLTASAFNLESGRSTAALQGSGTLTKTTAGSVTLSAANTLSGPVDLLAGTLTLAAAGKLSSGSLSLQNAATTLDLGATSQTTGAFRLAGGTLQNGSLTASAFNLESGLSSAALKGPGTLTKSTTGTVTLTGPNALTGLININAGTLLFAGTSLSSGSITVASGATLMGAATLPSAATLASGGFLSPGAASATGKLTLTGLSLTGGANLAFKLNAPLTSDQLALSTSNGFSLTGNNTITLSLAPGVSAPALGTYKLISYTGTTRTAGLSLTSPLFAGLDSRLVWNANDVSLLLGATTAPSATITSNFPSGLVQTGTLVSLASAVTGTPNFTYQWRKNGANLAGATLDTFQIPATALADSGTYDVVVSSNYGTSTSNSFNFSVADFQQPLTVTVSDSNPVTYSGTLGFLGGVHFVRNGSGAILLPATVAIPGSLTYSGSSVTPFLVSTSISSITKNIIQNSASSALTLAGTLSLNPASTTLSNKNTAPFTVASSITGTGTLTTQTSSSGSITLSGAVNPTGAFVNSGAGSGAITVSGSLGSALTSLTQNSSTSQLLLSAANLFAAPATVNAGSLIVSANNALGSTVGSTTVKTGATLDLRNVLYSTAEPLDLQAGSLLVSTGVSTFAGPIALSTTPASFQVNGTSLSLSGPLSGSAGFVKTGPGALFLSGPNSGSGPLTISAGSLLVNSGAALGSGSLNLGAGTTLAITAATDSTLSASLSGSGSITKSGAGTVTLAAANSTSGPLSITGGTLKVAAGASLGGGSISVAQGALLAFALTGDLTLSNVITGSVTSLNPAYRVTWNGGAVGGPVPVVTSPATLTLTLGSSLTYQVVATNGPNTFSATGLPSGLNFNAATGVLSGKPSAAGTTTISIFVTNPGGTTHFPLLLTVNFLPSAPAFTTQPASLTIPVGSTGTLTAKVLSRTAMQYQWKKNGVLVGKPASVPASNSDSTVTLSIANVSAATEGLFSIIATNSEGTTESAPAIVRVDLGLPKMGTARLLKAGTFFDLSKALLNSIVDLGSNFVSNDVFQITPSLDPATTYTWAWAPLTPGVFTTIASQTTSRLDFSADDVPKRPGYFNFVMKNKNGSTALRFRILSFGAPKDYPALPAAMTIATQPFPVTIAVGGAANFGAVFAGAPVSYSWYKINASGQTTFLRSNPSPFFTLSPASSADADDYFVVASDAYLRTKESSHVHLTVIPLGE